MSVERELFKKLKAFRADNVFNPWSDSDQLDCVDQPADKRLDRLKAHFILSPECLLLGEAPGYQGCHFSGIPFTNEKLLLDGAIPRVNINQRLTHRPRPWSEPSATIVWGALYELNIAHTTVLWNTFAWHPHKPKDPYSNRAPSPKELLAGLDVLSLVLSHLKPKRVIAVGKVAERTLIELAVPYSAAVRHPAMGGASAFRAGLKSLLG
jgi:uracil-DNA glycosylase